jgi:hypothetical protein
LRQADLVRAIEEGVLDARPLSSGPEHVLAVGRLGIFAVVFWVEVDDAAVLYSQLTLMRQEPTSRWCELGSGGGRRQLDEVPWTPPRDDGHGLFLLDSTALDTEDDDGVELVVRAVGGFGASGVAGMEVRREREAETEAVRLVPPLRPFALLAVGEDPIELAAHDDHGRRLPSLLC